MNTNEQSNAIRNSIVRGISFPLPLWERLEAEAARYGRRSRSQIVEWALSDWLDAQDAQRRSHDERTEGAA